MDNHYQQYIDRLPPYLTYGRAYDEDYVGIIVVRSKNFTTMYVLNDVNEPEMKKELMMLGERWWWQSNRNVPITVFMASDLAKFEFCKRTFLSKDFEVISGPQVSIMNLPTKRIKRCTTILKQE